MTIKTILLLPHAEHRERLLADGACGARPPWMRRGSVCGYESHRHWTEHDERDLSDCYMCRNGQEYALVLARDGAVVPEGVDRLRRVALAHRKSVGDAYIPQDADVLAMLAPNPSRLDLAVLAELYRRWGFIGTPLLLDANGKEVSGG